MAGTLENKHTRQGKYVRTADLNEMKNVSSGRINLIKTTYESLQRTMEKKKLKEIEAKLHQLLLQADKSKKQEAAAPSPKKIHVGGVIRRRRGHEDLHIT